MDPFEARLQFIKCLQRLNASSQANETAVQFVLKNHDLEEDLYSCVLEELDKSSLNARLNIFYFLEALCDNTEVFSRLNYAVWIGRDIEIIVEKVVPLNNLGVVNITPSQSIIDHLHKKGLIPAEKYESVQKLLKSRYKFSGDCLDVTSNDIKIEETFEMSNKEILRRMDEDRERTKRIKENIWAIDYKQDGDPEFEMLWNSLGPLTRLDYEQMHDDNDMCTSSIYVELPKIQ